jgi:sarcosine oxidase subunit beta
METADVTIIGAGIVGLAIAHELARSGVKSISILERQMLPGMGSTSSCTGGIRLQFSSEANIRFSKFGLERFTLLADELGVDIGLNRTGYLFLITREDQIFRYSSGHNLQKSLEVETYFVDKTWIGQIAEFLNLEDVISGSYCPLEAHADPHSVMEAYLSAIRCSGIGIDTNREVIGIGLSGNRVTEVFTNRGPISTGIIINCAGPWVNQVANMTGTTFPIISKKRHVLVIKPPIDIGQNLPIIIDSSSGWYMKSEPGNVVLMGGTDRDGKTSLETSPDPEMVDRIVEWGIKRVPAFENAGLVRRIVGLRAMSPDDHAIIGKVPYIDGLYCAAGFSGHGFMHAPATAVAMTELILHGESRSFDISTFNPSRFDRGALVQEPERVIF